MHHRSLGGLYKIMYIKCLTQCAVQCMEAVVIMEETSWIGFMISKRLAHFFLVSKWFTTYIFFLSNVVLWIVIENCVTETLKIIYKLSKSAMVFIFEGCLLLPTTFWLTWIAPGDSFKWAVAICDEIIPNGLIQNRGDKSRAYGWQDGSARLEMQIPRHQSREKRRSWGRGVDKLGERVGEGKGEIPAEDE